MQLHCPRRMQAHSENWTMYKPCLYVARLAESNPRPHSVSEMHCRNHAPVEEYQEEECMSLCVHFVCTVCLDCLSFLPTSDLSYMYIHVVCNAHVFPSILLS